MFITRRFQKGRRLRRPLHRRRNPLVQLQQPVRPHSQIEDERQKVQGEHRILPTHRTHQHVHPKLPNYSRALQVMVSPKQMTKNSFKVLTSFLGKIEFYSVVR